LAGESSNRVATWILNWMPNSIIDRLLGLVHAVGGFSNQECSGDKSDYCCRP
jgi:hypothetical protein